MTSILVKNDIVVTIDLNHRMLPDYPIVSIEVEKKADLIVIKHDILPTPHTQDSVGGHLIHSTTGRDVGTTIVEGNILMRDRRGIIFDEKARKEAQDAAAGLWQQLETVKPQMKHVGKPVGRR